MQQSPEIPLPRMESTDPLERIAGSLEELSDVFKSTSYSMCELAHIAALLVSIDKHLSEMRYKLDQIPTR